MPCAAVICSNLPSPLMMLIALHIARAQRERTLKFVPGGDLSLLDPVFTPLRATHNHAYLVFDTLYGLDETLTANRRWLKDTPWKMKARSGH